MATAREVETEPHRGRGRPAGSKYDPEIIRDMSEQVLIAFYNSTEGQIALRKRLQDDPGFPDKLRGKAASLDSTMRAWLETLEFVPRRHPQFKREAAFRFWCLRLDPPYPPETLRKKPDKEKALRDIYMKHCTDDHWNRNCKPWVDAIERVRHDHHFRLNVPTEEEDDEW